jgi:hypothetical protein
MTELRVVFLTTNSPDSLKVQLDAEHDCQHPSINDSQDNTHYLFPSPSSPQNGDDEDGNDYEPDLHPSRQALDKRSHVTNPPRVWDSDGCFGPGRGYRLDDDNGDQEYEREAKPSYPSHAYFSYASMPLFWRLGLITQSVILISSYR